MLDPKSSSLVRLLGSSALVNCLLVSSFIQLLFSLSAPIEDKEDLVKAYPQFLLSRGSSGWRSLPSHHSLVIDWAFFKNRLRAPAPPWMRLLVCFLFSANDVIVSLAAFWRKNGQDKWKSIFISGPLKKFDSSRSMTRENQWPKQLLPWLF